MSLIASQITSLTIVYSTVYSDADQRKHQSSAQLAFVGTDEFPAQMVCNEENVSIWWSFIIVLLTLIWTTVYIFGLNIQLMFCTFCITETYCPHYIWRTTPNTLCHYLSSKLSWQLINDSNIILACWCIPLRWCHSKRDGVSNHPRRDGLLNRLFRRRSKTSKLRVTGLCEGNLPLAVELPAWINGWVNNSEGGDLRRHRAHYDVTLMQSDDGANARLSIAVVLRLTKSQWIKLFSADFRMFTKQFRWGHSPIPTWEMLILSKILKQLSVQIFSNDTMVVFVMCSLSSPYNEC